MLLIVLASVLGWPQNVVPLHDLVPPVLKPSGEAFKFWSNGTPYVKKYHVDARSALAADTNSGTIDRPFKTIGRAAALLQPGECVVVHAGIYRECVRPPRGGASTERMIGYLAEGDVIVTGSEPAEARWSTVDAVAGVYRYELAVPAPGEYDPFMLENLPDAAFDIMEWAKGLRGKVPYTLPRGMVFQDGALLARAATRAWMEKTEGSYWTDRAARAVYVRTARGRDPNRSLMELTARRACFRPRVRGLGFIHVRGFVFEQVGNGFPRPQEGALSTGAGHHWLIEENTVRLVNGIGIDIGAGWYGGACKPPEDGPGSNAGWNIVRRNRVSDTGVCGIAGLPGLNALIEENELRRCTMYPVGLIFECAGIKTHGNVGALIRRNRIVDCQDHGIWMDYDNRDSRCTENTIVGARTGIHIEASVREPCWIDANRIVDVDMGIYENDCRGQVFSNNWFGRVGTAFDLQGKTSDRKPGGASTGGGGMLLTDNTFYQCREIVGDRRPTAVANENLRPVTVAQVPRELEDLIERAPRAAPVQILMNPSFESGTEGWALHCYNGAKAWLAHEGQGPMPAARITVRDGGMEAWNVQLVQPVKVEAGRSYAIRATLRGEREGMKATVGLQQDHEPHRLFTRNFAVGRTATRIAEADLIIHARNADTMRLVFFVGGDGPGTIWVGEVAVIQE